MRAKLAKPEYSATSGDLVSKQLTGKLVSAWRNKPHVLAWTLGIFTLLSAYSVYLYPGGSDLDTQASGFSWMHNYWCHLLDRTAINGHVNPGRSAAIAASLILCVGLAYTYFRLSDVYLSPLVSPRLTKVMLITALCSFIFLSTPFHDDATLVLCIAGILFLISLSTSLIYVKVYLAVAMIMVCMAISGLTALIYFTGWFMPQLALFQKISFAAFMVTTVYLNYLPLTEKNLNKN
ncbi:MAG: hypothetical protein IPN29_13405 [Saprospiraceae bacterium]|nr:hypothetical protein [Saprospiraceae bacterium]